MCLYCEVKLSETVVGVDWPPRGGTLKNSVYIGEANFFGVKILNFRIFLGFSEKLVIF